MNTENNHAAEKSKYSSVLHVDLSKNRVVAFQLSHRAEPKVKQRLETNHDYRQGMLAYVLEHVSDSDKERVIQTLMPEHLAAQLNFKNSVVCEFHEMRKGDFILFRLEICKDPEHPDLATIGIVVKAEGARKRKEYIVGSRGLILAGNAGSAAETLKEEYSLICVQHKAGVEKALKEHWDTAAALIVHAGCPDCQQIMAMVRSSDAYRSIPVIILAEPGSQAPEEQFLLRGAAEYMLSSCPPGILKSRVRNVVRSHDLAETVKQLEKDSQTGVYRKESFCRYAGQILQANPDGCFETIMVQIANIRALQGKYGDAVAGMVIDFTVSHILQELPGIVACGRFSDGDFALLRQADRPCEFERILTDIRAHAPVQNLALKAGAAHAGKSDTIKTLCDRAQRVINSIPETYGVHFAVYDEEMQLRDRKIQSILDSMETALEQKQFEVYYQPKHCTLSEKVCGAEALVRWDHPEYGFMNPAEFIPLFERVGFIRGLDRYIFANVCETIVRWKAMGLPLVPISVNLSRRDFETGDLADWILNLTKRMHIEPEWLHIEVTETAYTDNPEQISICLQRLHEEGFCIELDDFGAGYSSLTMLNDITVDILKIDRSIVEKDVPGQGRSILEFCMELAKIMKLKTVAEGVETEAQRRRICELGGNYIQGYYYSGPMRREDFEDYLRKNG